MNALILTQSEQLRLLEAIADCQEKEKEGRKPLLRIYTREAGDHQRVNCIAVSDTVANHTHTY